MGFVVRGVVEGHDILIQECQKSLPRDQTCEIVAVPVKKLDKP